MREIKFRAWDQVEKRMLFTGEPPHSLVLCGSAKYGGVSWRFADTFGESSDNQVCSGADGSILMQYTGIQDMAGRDIYEDDILETKGGLKMKVLYDHSILADLKTQIDTFDEENKWFVSGNIHENPELLTA